MFDVIIIGAGISGLSLALSLGNQGYSVAVIEKKLPLLHWEDDDYETKYSALNFKSCGFLKNIGTWKYFRKSCYSPMEKMEIWDNLGQGSISFSAKNTAQNIISYVFENREIVRGLWNHSLAHPNIKIIVGKHTQKINDNTVFFDKEPPLQAKLIVGADGITSWLRNAVNIDIIERPYYQSAITAVINIEKPHEYSAYQPFFDLGFLGVLPCRDKNLVSIVWSTETKHAKKLMSCCVTEFEQELTKVLKNKLGRVRCLSRRSCVPLTSLHARSYVKKNFVLVGDAAHAIHPLAGQGANLGLMDALFLFSIIKSEIIPANKEPNPGKGLLRYSLLRKSRNEKMILVMKSFKETFSSESSIIKFLRNFGFNAVDRSNFIKRTLSDFVNN